MRCFLTAITDRRSRSVATVSSSPIVVVAARKCLLFFAGTLRSRYCNIVLLRLLQYYCCNLTPLLCYCCCTLAPLLCCFCCILVSLLCCYCCTAAPLCRCFSATAAHLRCHCCHLRNYCCKIALTLLRPPARLLLPHRCATNTAAHLHCYPVLCICLTSLLQYYSRTIIAGASAILSATVRLAAVVGLQSRVFVFCFFVVSLLLVPLQASQTVSIF